MLLLLRGHIRNSFENDDLYYLIKSIIEKTTQIKNKEDIKIYIHTWNTLSNNISWRTIDNNNTPVTKQLIMNYFGDISNFIKEIIIDNDKNIEILGNTCGFIASGLMPTIGWKNYWYGKNHLINVVSSKNNNQEEMVINLRFDILNNSNTFTQKEIIKFIGINVNKKFTRNIFIKNTLICGIDNIYIGNIFTMKKLINHFHNSLDRILMLKKNLKVRCQEFLVFTENNALFDEL